MKSAERPEKLSGAQRAQLPSPMYLPHSPGTMNTRTPCPASDCAHPPASLDGGQDRGSLPELLKVTRELARLDPSSTSPHGAAITMSNGETQERRAGKQERWVTATHQDLGEIW